MSAEPSILDYVKSVVASWGQIRLRAPEAQSAVRPPTPKRRSLTILPWPGIVALMLALAGQASLEPGQNRSWVLGSLLYTLAALAMAWAAAHDRSWLAAFSVESASGDRWRFRKSDLALAALLGLAAFLSLGGNRFTRTNTFLWLLAIGVCIRAVWSPRIGVGSSYDGLRSIVFGPARTLEFQRWHIAVVSCFLLCVFLRVYRLWGVPPEMTSDHAEQLLNVSDLLGGRTSIYFTRFTGREGLLTYLTAWVSSVLGTGLSFASLKVVTVFFGLCTLPYVYLLGRDLVNPGVGLCAMILTGIGYWPDVLARSGQSFALYPFFVAATSFHLLRGLRRGAPGHFVLAGLLLGLGLHGYGAFWVFPCLVLLAAVLFCLNRHAVEERRTAVRGIGVLFLISLMVALPLLRYAASNPRFYFSRAAANLLSQPDSLPGPAWQIFLGNLWHALTMCMWDNGEVWVFSSPHRPALDVASAALFGLGAVVLAVRYFARRHWLDAFLLLSVPMLMMPSIISLAAPRENPSLALAGGASVAIFLIAGVALDWLLGAARSHLGHRRGEFVASAMFLALVTGAALQNHRLVFKDFLTGYRLNSWNSSEMGRTIRAFIESVGSPGSAWVVSYPHWVDTRLVAMEAGYPSRDFEIKPEHLSNTLASPRAKIFLLKPEDKASLAGLHALYPNGEFSVRGSRTPTKEFLVFWVPPREASQ